MEHAKRSTNRGTTEPVGDSPKIDRSLNKRLEKVGTCQEHIIYQLRGSISCLDCYRSMPTGALVTQKPGWASGEMIPACLGTVQGLDLTKLKLTENISPCKAHACGLVSNLDRVEEVVNRRDLTLDPIDPAALEEEDREEDAAEEEFLSRSNRGA